MPSPVRRATAAAVLSVLLNNRDGKQALNLSAALASSPVGNKAILLIIIEEIEYHTPQVFPGLFRSSQDILFRYITNLNIAGIVTYRSSLPLYTSLRTWSLPFTSEQRLQARSPLVLLGISAQGNSSPSSSSYSLSLIVLPRRSQIHSHNQHDIPPSTASTCCHVSLLWWWVRVGGVRGAGDSMGSAVSVSTPYVCRL